MCCNVSDAVLWTVLSGVFHNHVASSGIGLVEFKAYLFRLRRRAGALVQLPVSELRLLGSVGLFTACEAPASGIILAPPALCGLNKAPHTPSGRSPYAAIHKNGLAYKALLLQLHPTNGCVFMCTQETIILLIHPRLSSRTDHVLRSP
jgi:hypothetical protein